MRSWSKTVTARLPCRRSSSCRRGSVVSTCRYLLSTSSRSSRVQAMTRSQIWREHLPTPATKHKRAGVGCRARRIRSQRGLHRLRMSTQLPLRGPRACGPRSPPLTPSGNGSCRTAHRPRAAGVSGSCATRSWRGFVRSRSTRPRTKRRSRARHCGVYQSLPSSRHLLHTSKSSEQLPRRARPAFVS